VWEGGGSQRRRKIYPEYKLNRRPEKLNRFYGDDIPDSEENKQHQLISLLGFLKNVPVCQIYASDCEGDDVVAFLSRGPLHDKDKVIVSSDKDMYQLLDEKTKIYSLHRKRFIDSQVLLEEFRISSSNFAIAKCLCGDPSDNIPGIKGLGFKTVAAKFPFLSGEDSVIVQDLINYSASHSEDSAIYKRIAENKEDVMRNWKLIHLDGSMLSVDQINKIENVINTFEPRVNRMGFIKRLISEGINDFDVEGFYYDLSCIEGAKHSLESK
jgi:5'-3' exonuclease